MHPSCEIEDFVESPTSRIKDSPEVDVKHEWCRITYDSDSYLNMDELLKSRYFRLRLGFGDDK